MTGEAICAVPGPAGQMVMWGYARVSHQTQFLQMQWSVSSHYDAAWMLQPGLEVSDGLGGGIFSTQHEESFGEDGETTAGGERRGLQNQCHVRLTVKHSLLITVFHVVVAFF